MLAKAVAMFEDFLQYTNHLGLCTEEISDAGEAYVASIFFPFHSSLLPPLHSDTDDDADHAGWATRCKASRMSPVP